MNKQKAKQLKYLKQTILFSGDDLYTEWVPQPHGSWNHPSWQDPGQLAPPPDSDAQWLKDTAPLEQFTKEPEGSACLRWLYMLLHQGSTN